MFPIRNPDGPRSKWDILQERTEKAYDEWVKLTQELKYLTETPFVVNGTGCCSACGEELSTEADFAKHFLIPDERYYNLGYCPKGKKDGS